MAATVMQVNTYKGRTGDVLYLFEIHGNAILNNSPNGSPLTQRTVNVGTYYTDTGDEVTEDLTGIKEYKVLSSTGQLIASGITQVLVDDTGTYNCLDSDAASGLTAPQTRTALGMASADLDDQLDAIAAADPLLNAVPGSYAAGTAGRALGLIGTVTFTYADSTIVGGAIVPIKAGDLKTLTLTSDTADVVPDLTGVTMRFGVKQGDRQLIETTSVVVDVATGLQSVTVTILPSETVNLDTQNAVYDLQAEYSATNHRTLISGACAITNDNSGT